jgi:hypothetical protein
MQPIALSSNSIHIRALINSLTGNNNKTTSIMVHTFTYNPLILRHVSTILSHPHGALHQASIYKTQHMVP